MGDAMMLDGRGKALCEGGRYRTAQQARFLRRSGAGNVAARLCIASAKRAYVEAGSRRGWSAQA